MHFSYNRQAKASGTRDEVKGFTHSGRQAGKDPRSRVSQKGHQGKEDSPVAEDRADLNLLEPENDEEQNDMLSGKKLEQENDETMPVDNNEAGGKKKKRIHRSRFLPAQIGRLLHHQKMSRLKNEETGPRRGILRNRREHPS
jgi:hypothetical protein